MSDAIRVWPEIQRNSDGTILVSGIYENMPKDRKRIWFSLPKGVEPNEGAIGHALLLAGLFSAMELGKPYHLHGTVSSSALANLAEINAIWSCWRPERYRQLSYDADTVVMSEGPQGTRDTGWVLTFSGGLDSCTTLWRHTRQDLGWQKRPISRAVFVHGYDIPLNDAPAFERARKRAAAITESVDIPLCTVKTNIRIVLSDSWEDSYATKMAAILHLFNPTNYGGLLAADESYASPVLTWGSTPIANPFLGSAEFSVFSDGAERSRLQKIELLQTWQACMKNLRVCWQPEAEGANCGICEKCVRTKLELACWGIQAPAFPSPLTVEEVKGIKVTNVIQLTYLKEIVAFCHEHDLRADWRPALESIVNAGLSPR